MVDAASMRNFKRALANSCVAKSGRPEKPSTFAFELGFVFALQMMDLRS